MRLEPETFKGLERFHEIACQGLNVLSTHCRVEGNIVLPFGSLKIFKELRFRHHKLPSDCGARILMVQAIYNLLAKLFMCVQVTQSVCSKSGCERGVCSKREVQRGVEQVHVHAKHISTQAKMLAIRTSPCAKCGPCSWPELCVFFSRTCREGSAKDVPFVKKTQKCQRTMPIILMLGKRRPFSPLRKLCQSQKMSCSKRSSPQVVGQVPCLLRAGLSTEPNQKHNA